MKHSLPITLGLAMAVIAADRPAFATSYTNTIAQMTASITTNMAAQNVQGLCPILAGDNRRHGGWPGGRRL